jgi:hypothetical protein
VTQLYYAHSLVTSRGLLVVDENGYARPFFPLHLSCEMRGGCPLVSFSEQVVSASEKWKCSHAMPLYSTQMCLKKCRRWCHKECLFGLQKGVMKADQYRIMFFWFWAHCYGLIRGVPEFNICCSEHHAL